MRIILTHSRNRFSGLHQKLESFASVLHVPLVRTETLEQAPTHRLNHNCMWWAITSQASIEALHGCGFDFSGHRFAVLSHRAARSIEALGGTVGLILADANTNINALTLAEAILNLRPRPSEIVFAHGDQALQVLPQTLEQAGLRVERLCIYRTVAEPWPLLQPKLSNQDLIVLFSPSAVKALPEEIGSHHRLITLGQHTAAAVAARGWSCKTGHDMRQDEVVKLIVAEIRR